MKIIIAGSRTVRGYEQFKKECDMFFAYQLTSEFEIVSGGQRSYDEKKREYYGADFYGEQYAQERKWKLTIFNADWHQGKVAGYLRNKKMAEYADGLIAFWDGKSKGTKMMIDLARKHNLKIKIIEWNKWEHFSQQTYIWDTKT